jgi:hypothetical protein
VFKQVFKLRKVEIYDACVERSTSGIYIISEVSEWKGVYIIRLISCLPFIPPSLVQIDTDSKPNRVSLPTFSDGDLSTGALMLTTKRILVLAGDRSWQNMAPRLLGHGGTTKFDGMMTLPPFRIGSRAQNATLNQAYPPSLCRLVETHGQ